MAPLSLPTLIVMSHNYLDDIRVQIGAFTGGAPPETIALWQSLIPVQIQVHHNPENDLKTYLVNDFPPEMNSYQYAEALESAGIVGAKSVHLMDGNRLRKGWDGFKIIGLEVAVIEPLPA